MPIRNVGTILENLVVTETALTLLRYCGNAAPFEFLNSFAMPPLSEWQPHRNETGFDNATLLRLRAAADSLLPTGICYPHLLRSSLLADYNQGPNAALLIAGIALQSRIPCRMWLNDIRNGQYGDAIPALEKLEATAREMYRIKPGTGPTLGIQVCDTPYPDSLANLAATLQRWSPRPGARLGFLDPMRYCIQDRDSTETSSEDHRLWLKELAFEGVTCAAHYTGHSDQPTLKRELVVLHQDAIASGYTATRTFRRQHYAVFLAARAPIASEAAQLAADIEQHVRESWEFWRNTFTDREDWPLTVHRNGVAVR